LTHKIGFKKILSEAFCEHPFALQRQQPEKDKQNVDVAHPWKKFCGRPRLLSPFQQALTYGQVRLKS